MFSFFVLASLGDFFVEVSGSVAYRHFTVRWIQGPKTSRNGTGTEVDPRWRWRRVIMVTWATLISGVPIPLHIFLSFLTPSFLLFFWGGTGGVLFMVLVNIKLDCPYWRWIKRDFLDELRYRLLGSWISWRLCWCKRPSVLVWSIVCPRCRGGWKVIEFLDRLWVLAVETSLEVRFIFAGKKHKLDLVYVSNYCELVCFVVTAHLQAVAQVSRFPKTCCFPWEWWWISRNRLQGFSSPGSRCKYGRPSMHIWSRVRSYVASSRWLTWCASSCPKDLWVLAWQRRFPWKRGVWSVVFCFFSAKSPWRMVTVDFHPSMKTHGTHHPGTARKWNDDSWWSWPLVGFEAQNLEIRVETSSLSCHLRWVFGFLRVDMLFKQFVGSPRFCRGYTFVPLEN